MSEHTISRRRVLAGTAAALGGAAIAPAAQAFPRSAAGQLRAASRILAPFGVEVRGTSADARVARDILTLEVEPQANTQYDHLLGPRNDLGGIIPCIKTSVFGGVEELSLFEAEEGISDPSWRTVRQGGVIVSDHFHPGARNPSDPADVTIIPCVRTTIVGHSLASFEAFGLTEGDLEPCMRVETQMFADGALGSIALTVDPALRSFTVQVGDHLYHLEGGELVRA